MLICKDHQIFTVSTSGDKHIVMTRDHHQSATRIGDVRKLPDGQWEAKFWFRQERGDTPREACLRVLEASKGAP